MIYTISDIQKLCTPIFLEWKIKKAFLFGSYARNEATETSDLDILIDGEGSLLQNIFDVIRLKSKLSSALKKEIDLITLFIDYDMLVELLNTMKDNGHFEEFKQLAKEEDIFKKATYGEGDPNKEKKSFYEGRMYGPDGIYYRLGNSILQELKKENDSSQQDNPFRPSSLSGKQNPNKEIYNRMKQEYFKGKETNESRSPPKRNPNERIKPFKESFKYRRSVTNQVKHLERVTSNEFDQFKNKVAFEKLQREIEQAKMSQESDLFN